jgi:hypothetical protein
MEKLFALHLPSWELSDGFSFKNGKTYQIVKDQFSFVAGLVNTR